MTISERKLELIEDLKPYIKKEGLDLLTLDEDFESLLVFSKKYELLYIDGSKIYFYLKHKEYSAELDKQIDTFSLLSKELTKDKENIFLSLTEIDIKGNVKIKKENISTFFMTYRKAEPKTGLDFIITKKEVKHNKINLWQGFNDIEEEATTEDIKLFLDLIYTNLASEDQAQYEYVLKYLTHMLLKPYELPRVSIVMPGPQGIGKGSLLDIINKWINPINYIKLTSTNDLVGFNRLLEGKLIIFADEATFAYDKSSAGVIKNLITSNTHLIERKGIDKYQMNNYARLIIASNNKDQAALIENGDRRYFALDTQAVLPLSFFEKYHYELENNNLAGKVMYWLKKNVDISNIHFERDMPKTQTHADIQSDKLPDIIRFIKAIACGDYEDDGLTFKYSTKDNDYCLQVEGSVLFNIFSDVYGKTNRQVLDKNKFGKLLKEYIPSVKNNKIMYLFAIQNICKVLNKETKNPAHSQEILEYYKTIFIS